MIEDSIFFGVLDGDFHRMHAVALVTLLHQRTQLRRSLDSMTNRALTLGIFHEFRISVVEPKLIQPHVGLLAVDHPVGIVTQDQHHQL